MLVCLGFERVLLRLGTLQRNPFGARTESFTDTCRERIHCKRKLCLGFRFKVSGPAIRWPFIGVQDNTAGKT